MYGFSERNILEMNDIFSSIPNIAEVGAVWFEGKRQQPSSL